MRKGAHRIEGMKLIILTVVAALARLSQFAGIFGYFGFKTATKFNDCSEAISKRAAVKTYPLAKA